MKLKIYLIVFVMTAMSSARTNIDFDFEWCFGRGDFATAMIPVFDDSEWKVVNLPHDWS
ncbi:unnamed protein product, partial [marine sediment metagenome]